MKGQRHALVALYPQGRPSTHCTGSWVGPKTGLGRCGKSRTLRVLVGGNLTERGHLEDPVVDGRIILRWIFGKWDAGMDWIELAQDRDRWRALVNDLTKLQVP